MLDAPDKTKRQLLEEIRVLRSRNAKLENLSHEMPKQNNQEIKAQTDQTSQENEELHTIAQCRISEHIMRDKQRGYIHNTYRMLVIGVGLTAFFWILESVLHAFVFHDSSFMEQILPPNDHDLMMRLLVCFVLIWFSIYAQIIVKKLKQAKVKLQQSHDELEFHVRERTAELAKTNEKLQEEITERKNTEKMLRQHDEFLGNVLESLTHPFLVINTDDYTIDMLNSTAWKGELAEGTKCYEVSHKRDFPCDDHEHPCPLEHIKKTGQSTTVEHIHYDQSGNAQIVEVHGYPLCNDQGKVTKMIESCIDVTERKKAEEALEESERQFRATFEQAAVGVAHVAPNGKFIRVNKKFCDIVGYSLTEILDCNFQEITHPDDLDVDLGYIQQMLADELSTYSLEKRYFRKDGSIVWVKITVSLFWEDLGLPKFFISVVEDITDRKRAEEQARVRQAELLHVSRLSTIGEMASSLAHELNQPLCAILSCSDLCLQSNRQGIKNPEQFNENLETIATQTERAGNIINRIRDFVKKRDSHREPVDINNLIRETLHFINTDIRHSGVKVNIELSEQIPKVMADPIQIEQVLINLLRNALEAMEYIEPEKRNLTIKTSMDSSNNVKVIIRDSGYGLTPEIKEQLFNPFFSTKSEGLGIGLSISHSIVEAHKGEIWAKSNSDCGSTFTFKLPVS